jgi:hypothetical protein
LVEGVTKSAAKAEADLNKLEARLSELQGKLDGNVQSILTTPEI